MNLDASHWKETAQAAAGAQDHPAPALYVVATPIGNLADLSLRAVHVLAVADVFDTVTANRDPGCPETIRAGVEAVREGSGTFFDPGIVAVWESIYPDVMQLKSGSAHPTAYQNIQLATSEIKVLESLADSITGLTSFDAIASAVRTLLESLIPQCSVSLRQGHHDGVPVLSAARAESGSAHSIPPRLSRWPAPRRWWPTTPPP